MAWEGYPSRLCKCNDFNVYGLFGRDLLELASRIDAIEKRHDVQDGDVRMQTGQHPDSLLAVGGVAYYLEPLAFQKRFQSLTNKCVIVGENYSDRHFISRNR
jgi:hypothetical protein